MTSAASQNVDLRPIAPQQIDHPKGPLPRLIPGTHYVLGINSAVNELPLYAFSLTGDVSVREVMTHFTQMSDLPGVLITEGTRVSVLSRHQFLELWLQLGQTEGFAEKPVREILTRSNHKPLILFDETSILTAARQALKRPLEKQSEPLVVVTTGIDQADSYYLLESRTLNVAHWQIRGIETQIRYERLQMQLLQSEKMAALGRLVDGVAHEILDPVSFIWGNLSYIASYTQQQSDLLMAYDMAFPNPPAEIGRVKQEIEFDYVRTDLPAAVKSARGGAHRLRQLATSLQNFCHIDEVHPRPTDINTLLDSTLRLLRSRLTTHISIERSYGKLPPVPCFSGQLSQVFMNIFINAMDSLLAQAQQEEYIEDYGTEYAQSTSAPTPKKTPQITVTTCVCAAQDTPEPNPHEARWISIIISDNGPGMSPQIKEQVIDSFSTKSRSRKETGLALSYQIITAKHGGQFWMRSLHASEAIAAASDAVPTTGTEFEILLPLTISEPAKK
ncbi:MAG: ATP-binding protein [Cyanobacteria bacterium P01_A01_bin.116]